MAAIRSIGSNDPFKLTDLVDDVIDTKVQPTMLEAMNLFEDRSTDKESITFRVNQQNYSLLPQTDKKAGSPSVGSDGTSKYHSLVLPYFDHYEALEPMDLQDNLVIGVDGREDEEATIEKASLQKVRAMVRRGAETREHLRWEALKGNTVDESGTVIANMFTEFGVAQQSTDFVLGTDTTDISGKIQDMLINMATYNKNGMALTRPIVLCGYTFFKEFVNHPKVVAAWEQYQNAEYQRNRDNLFTFRDYGATGEFEHRGIRFVSYEPEFTAADGVTKVKPVATNDGYVILPQAQDLYRGYNGPTRKMNLMNRPGEDYRMFMYDDPKGNGRDFEYHMSYLPFMTNPLLSHKVTTSN